MSPMDGPTGSTAATCPVFRWGPSISFGPLELNHAEPPRSSSNGLALIQSYGFSRDVLCVFSFFRGDCLREVVFKTYIQKELRHGIQTSMKSVCHANLNEECLSCSSNRTY